MLALMILLLVHVILSTIAWVLTRRYHQSLKLPVGLCDVFFVIMPLFNIATILTMIALMAEGKSKIAKRFFRL